MAWNSLWEDIFQSKPWGKYPSEDLIRFIARNFYNVENRSNIKILEVGSGTGSNIWYLANEGFSVYGIEGSKTGVQITQERLMQDKNIDEKKTKVFVGDMEKLPFEEGYFDAVIDIEAISTNNWKDSLEILAEIERVLKPNGKFYSRHFAEDSQGDKAGELVDRHMFVSTEGVLANIGPTRFATKQDVFELYGESFNINSLGKIIRETENEKQSVIEWTISMAKKG
ncbi:class I SAM-dependent methyltransferase [Kurthia huakuii]|uniref:class I SAM-dependent methyltransferase n=1 Tax=Kurthia huakuii TaxID=1421019 RepID=UPI0004971924|nr:class I SAM-dependent methyltransferase [Kurthia huakuii]MBM7700750.1 ubiquinone/menaquinone biosynthesis C-methylase UbiE [Kurthia huakuii]